MRDIENTINRASNPSSRRLRTTRTTLSASFSVAALLLIAGCDGMVEESEPVEGQSAALRNTGRTPEQQKCDEKLQSCYVDCSVKYPESGGGLNDDLREGCFDSCDASHNLCSPARTVGATVGGVLQPGAVLDAQLTTPLSPRSAAVTAPAASAALKSCTATSDGGLWCCVPISTPPYLKCTYTPPPDTIWTFTQTATRAP
jgi:hypothetical protein